MKARHKYILQCSILFIVYLFVAIFLLFFYPSVLSLAICLLIILPCKLFVTYFANQNFIPILAQEFNAQKFYSTVYQTPFRPSAFYRLNAEWYIGNYKKLIDLSSAGFKHSKRIRLKCAYLASLARAYFETKRRSKNFYLVIRYFNTTRPISIRISSNASLYPKNVSNRFSKPVLAENYDG